MVAIVLGTPKPTLRAIVHLLLSPVPLPPLQLTGLLVGVMGLCEVLCVDNSGTFTSDDVEDNVLLEELGNIVESSLGGGPEKVSFVGSEQLAVPSAFVLQQYQSRSWLL